MVMTHEDNNEDNTNLLFPGLPTAIENGDRKRVPTLSNAPADPDPATAPSHSLRASDSLDPVADD